ncbi:MAG TPA: ABC transporter substrate-binding protein [Jatrophihabitantaceae bacterium]|jgi:ABC-type branched-subunit amino acid transport system substrate-binding protein
MRQRQPQHQQWRRRRGRAFAALCIGVATALVASACGSAVPPAEYARANSLLYGGQAALAQSGAPAAEQAAAAATAGAIGPSGSAGLPGRSGSAAVGGSAGTSAVGGASSGGNAVAGVHAGSCAGFANATGISNSSIKIANASDVSGPISGLFQSAEQATTAYAAYFNSTSTICGRKLSVETLDSQTSDEGDQQAATTACGNAFAMVGSTSAADNGGAATVTNCGIPDLRALSTTPQRYSAPVSFGTDSINPNVVSTEPWRFVKAATGNAYQKAGIIYLDQATVITNAKADKATAASLGYNFVYDSSVAVATFNYAPFVSRMASLGVSFVEYVGAYQYAVRLQQAMNQQGFHPVFLMDSVAYDPGYVASVGSVGYGTWAFTDTALFEESGRNPEMQTYVAWLHRTYPSAVPSFFGLFAWAAAKLFTQLAVQLGGKLNRQSLLAAIRGVRSYDGNGLFAKQNVGGKQTANCDAVIQLEQGGWQRRSPYPFVCSTLFSS